MINRIIFLSLFLITLSLFFVNSAKASTSQTSTYTIDNSNFANPERGLLHFSGIQSTSTLQGYRTNENITLIMINHYLDSYVDSPIAQSELDLLQNAFNSLRVAGVKVILRFAYTESRTGTNASLSRILSHIDQLAPVLQANKDVISVWQAGFIGAWGEWYYTSNSSADFGDQGNISATQWANRKAVVDKMLSVLPSRMVSLRTPLFKRTMYGQSALTSLNAFSGTAVARIGHHNDAFVASSDDYGTYADKNVEYPYLASDTNYVPMGGENDNYDSSRTICQTALSEMQMFHWTYINTDYYTPTINNWSSQGCLDTMKKNLGYRFVLQQATYPISINAGESSSINLTIKNDGYATPYNPRPLYLVLYNTNNSYTIPINSDPRRWTAGQVTNINQQITIPSNVVSGTYKLGLWLPDESQSLQSKSYFSIRFANTNMWDQTLGYNLIAQNIQIGNNGGTPTYNASDQEPDGDVDYLDFNTLVSNFGLSGVVGWIRSDIIKDGVVNIFDFNKLISNMGK